MDDRRLLLLVVVLLLRLANLRVNLHPLGTTLLLLLLGGRVRRPEPAGQDAWPMHAR